MPFSSLKPQKLGDLSYLLQENYEALERFKEWLGSAIFGNGSRWLFVVAPKRGLPGAAAEQHAPSQPGDCRATGKPGPQQGAPVLANIYLPSGSIPTPLHSLDLDTIYQAMTILCLAEDLEVKASRSISHTIPLVASRSTWCHFSVWATASSIPP